MKISEPGICEILFGCPFIFVLETQGDFREGAESDKKGTGHMSCMSTLHDLTWSESSSGMNLDGGMGSVLAIQVKQNLIR